MQIKIGLSVKNNKNNYLFLIISIIMVCFLITSCNSKTERKSNNDSMQDVKNNESISIEQKNLYTLNNKSNYYADYLNIKNIYDEAENVAWIITSELLLQEGRLKDATNIYLNLIDSTKSPEIAKRAEQLALSIGDLNLADEIHKKWKKIEPKTTANQELLMWQKKLIYGDINYVFNKLPTIIKNINNKNDLKNVFSFLIDLSINIEQVNSKKNQRIVHNSAINHYDLLEAKIADLIFSVNTNNKQQATIILKDLISNDELNQNLFPLMQLIYNKKPDIFNVFFEQLNEGQLNEMSFFWNIIYIESLLRKNEIKKAYKVASNQLQKNQTTELYMQTGYIASYLNEDKKTIEDYFSKAFGMATEKQKDKVALFASISLLNVGGIDLAKEWVNKIDSTKLPFDKNYLTTIIALKEKNIPLFKEKVKYLSSLEKQSGIFYQEKDLINLKIVSIKEYEKPEITLAEFDKMLNKYGNFSISDIKKNQDLKSEISIIYYEKALLLSDKMEEHEKAIEYLKKYLELNPNSPMGLNALGYTMLNIKNQRKEALKILQKALKLDPNSPATMDSLGWAYFLNQEYNTALPLLEKAYVKLDDEIETITHLAALYYKINKKTDAIKLFKKAQKIDPKNKLLLQIIKEYQIKIE